jgi:hypothetical protein
MFLVDSPSTVTPFFARLGERAALEVARSDDRQQTRLAISGDRHPPGGSHGLCGDAAEYADPGRGEPDGGPRPLLVIEARDARSGRLLWYGSASAVVNPELREKRLLESIRQIFASWPAHARTGR